MFINATNKSLSLVMTDLADVDGLKICIQVCVWLGFRMDGYEDEINLRSTMTLTVAFKSKLKPQEKGTTPNHSFYCNYLIVTIWPVLLP